MKRARPQVKGEHIPQGKLPVQGVPSLFYCPTPHCLFLSQVFLLVCRTRPLDPLDLKSYYPTTPELPQTVTVHHLRALNVFWRVFQTPLLREMKHDQVLWNVLLNYWVFQEV